MASRGLTVTTKVLDQAIVVPPPHVRQRLALDEGQSTTKIDRLRSVEGQVLMFVQTYVPYRLCPDLVKVDVSEGSLYALLRDRYGLAIATGKRLVEAVRAHRPSAACWRSEAVLRSSKSRASAICGNGQPLEYYEAWHRGDRSRFEIEMIVGDPAVLDGRQSTTMA